MIPARRLVGILAFAVVLLAQLHAWEAKACSMCGAQCKCAARATSNACCLRAVGCGGSTTEAAVAGDAPLRAVLAAVSSVAPPHVLDRTSSTPIPLPTSPALDPPERPPRVSC